MVLPTYPPAAASDFSWSQLDSESFSHALDAIYAEVVHWKKNSFKIPHEKAGKEFVSELARLFTAFAEKSALESIGLKAVTVLATVVLQKPSQTSKAKAHITCLERRLLLWKDGNLNQLVLEGRAIQQRLPRLHPPSACQQLAQSFANLMFTGNTKAALRLITEQDKGGVLSLDDAVDTNETRQSVRGVLESKHPPPQPLRPDAVLPTDIPP